MHSTWYNHSYCISLINAAATIYFAAGFVWVLFEGGAYFFGKPGDINEGWIRYVRVRRWWLLDAASSMRSLSVLLSAVGTTRTTQTVLALAWLPSSEIICTHGRVPCLLPAATIRGRRLFEEIWYTWLHNTISIHHECWSFLSQSPLPLQLTSPFWYTCLTSWFSGCWRRIRWKFFVKLLSV